MTNNKEFFLKVTDAASALSVTPSRVYQMIDENELEAEERCVEGRGWQPITMVRASSILAYAKRKYQMKESSTLYRSFLNLIATSPDIVRNLAHSQVIDALQRYDVGESVYSLATSFGVSNGSMRNLLKAHGRKLRSQRNAFDARRKWIDRVSPATIEEVKIRYNNGEGCPKIAIALGWGRQGAAKVRRILEEEGVGLRDRSHAASAFWQRRKVAA